MTSTTMTSTLPAVGGTAVRRPPPVRCGRATTRAWWTRRLLRAADWASPVASHCCAPRFDDIGPTLSDDWVRLAGRPDTNVARS